MPLFQVKKVYGDKSVRNRRRKWRLRHMEGLHDKIGAGTSSQGDVEYQHFLEDLEEDAELRDSALSTSCVFSLAKEAITTTAAINVLCECSGQEQKDGAAKLLHSSRQSLFGCLAVKLEARIKG